jgi:transposase-like protein
MGRKRGLSDEQIERVQHLYHNTDNKVSQIARTMGISPGPIHNIIERKGAYKDIAPFVKKEVLPKEKKKEKPNNKLQQALSIVKALNDAKLDRAIHYLRCLQGPKR